MSFLIRCIPVIFSLLVTQVAHSADFASVKEKLTLAMNAESRPEDHAQRDGNRKPIETLYFMGLRDDMSVIELIPGGGWYTRLLAPVLKAKGKLYVAYGSGWMGDLLAQPEMKQVKLLAEASKLYKPENSAFFTLTNGDLGVKNVDMVLTFRNYHNFDANSRKAINDAVWQALKPGGIYGVVDHTKRHMEDQTSENRRRFDPVLAIKEIQAAGFELVDYSDLHYRPDDELRYEVGRKTVTGNTDRFTLKFRKVKK